MKNILSYDSKLMIMLEGLANTMLLNILFLICCVPVVTIGAAFTALFGACRALMNDEPCFRAFFRGLRSGFKRSTLAWLIQGPVLAVLALTAHSVWVYMNAGVKMGMFTLIVALVGLVIALAVTMMTYLFYSRFECSLWQLLKNGLFMTLAYFIRAVIIGLFNWAPVIMFFLVPYTFLRLSIVFVVLWFGVSASLSVWLMKKPFASLEQAARGAET
ncbi:MAG: DUF624 domain-containing protein [Ruminococcaceae bacterium]|nr:DUF624 domain-containing protein [Oscillospiraceae bacterium]